MNLKKTHHLHRFPLELELAVALVVAVDIVPFVVVHSFHVAVVDLDLLALLVHHAPMDNEDLVDNIDNLLVDVDTLDIHIVDLVHIVAHTVDSIEVKEKYDFVKQFEQFEGKKNRSKRKVRFKLVVIGFLNVLKLNRN